MQTRQLIRLMEGFQQIFQKVMQRQGLVIEIVGYHFTITLFAELNIIQLSKKRTVLPNSDYTQNGTSHFIIIFFAELIVVHLE